MAVAVKRLRLGRRRSRTTESTPLELALAPALRDGRWRVPDRFNFTRDVVEVLGANPKRRALTFVGADGIIEPRTFRELAEGANRWASILRSEDVRAGDRVLALSGATVDWVELVLGCVKAGVVVVPCPPDITAPELESRFVTTGAALVIATDDSKTELARMSFTPPTHHLFEGRRRRASDVVDEQPTEDTSSRDVAFIAWTAGTTGPPRPVAHTHGATHAARCAVEHWLGAGPGDVVWCTAAPGSLQALTTTVFGAWARGAEVALHDGAFDPVERLELLHRFDVTIVCQTPSEYRALAGRRELGRYRSRRLRRLVSTGDYLDPEVVQRFEESWGATIRNGYGQAETNIVVAHGLEDDSPAASLGRPVPGHHVAVVDDHGNELPAGVEGSLAVRGRPPTLFAGYWDLPDETRDAFRGDWYLTGDVAVADEHGNLWFVARAEDTITSRGRTFGPHEVERVLRTHDVVRDSAVVGLRDLERGGHFVRAFVILEDGVEGSEQLEAELRHFVAQTLVEQQVPREIEFIDALPTSPTGSVRRGELRDRPVAGRPLWELPPTTEPELEQLPAPETAVVDDAPAAPTFLDTAQLVGRPGAGSAQHPAVEPVEQPAGAFAAPPEASAAPELAAEAAPVVPAEPEPPSLPEEGQPAAEAVVEPAAPPPAPPEDTARPEPEVEPEPTPGAVAPEREPAASALPPDVAVDTPAAPVDLGAREEQKPPEQPAAPAAEASTLEPFGSDALAHPPPAPAGRGAEPDRAPEQVANVEEPEPEPKPRPAAEPAPVVELVPPPAPAVDPASEPLPDYVVEPARGEERPAPPPAPPAPPEDEEEDLGPLPEYIVDPSRPSRRLEPVASNEPEPTSFPPVDPGAPPTPSFPSVPVLDLSARRDVDETTGPQSGQRQRPATPPPAPKRRGSAAEPGDEAEETTWMRGLSSRLSAYSLDEDEEKQGRRRGDREGETDDGEQQEKDGD